MPADPALMAAKRLLTRTDRKSTRLNSSHVEISYAVFCLKKKNGGRVFEESMEELAPLERIVVYGISSRKHNTVKTGCLLRRSHDLLYLYFFFNETPPTEIDTLSLHDALPI